jgi:hypothetical protein
MRRIFRVTAGLVLVTGGLVLAAPAASATTTDRGASQIMSCDNLVISSQVKDASGHGVDLTIRNMKVSGAKHPESTLPTGSDAQETDPFNTPDYGDTDTCTGALALSPLTAWVADGVSTPHSPIQPYPYSNTVFNVLNDVTKATSALTGRVNCQTIPPPTSAEKDHMWVLHGKLTVAFGEDPAGGGTPGTPTARDGLLRPVQSQIFVNIDRNADAMAAGVHDVLDIRGIVTKGTGEGAWFDMTAAARPYAVTAGVSATYLGIDWATEACLLGVDFTGDGIVGEPPTGGIVHFSTDTDVDTDETGIPCGLGGYCPGTVYDNSADWSI